MDDWIVIASTRWKLRSVVRIVYETLNTLRVEKHPDKTFIGKVERGCNFLGYFLIPGIVRVAIDTIKRFAHRISQLYEQGADEDRIGDYMRHWCRWVGGGVTLMYNNLYGSWGDPPNSHTHLYSRVCHAFGE